MKYLKESDWAKFIKPDKTHDGLMFESLIKKILELEYGEDTWQSTKASWDGSKDFYWHTHDHRRWAECKNYKSDISLNVLSPTLVMAQIYNVNDILFFSYSSIIKTARQKIIQFGLVSEKNIYFYDDDALEQIILKHKTDLFPVFFPDVDIEAAKAMPSPPIIKKYIIQDPLMAYRMDSDSQLFTDSFSKKIDMLHLMSILVLISNRSKDTIEVEIDLDRNEDSDLYYLELLPSELKKDTKRVTIEPFQQYIEKFYFRQVVSKKYIKFPDMSVQYHLPNGISGLELYHFNSYESNPIRESLLWGSTYRKIVENFESECFYGTKLSGLVLYGTSGTGKTRVMQECMHKSLNNHYRVLQFSAYRNIQNQNQINALEIMKEVILAIYDIPNVDVLDWAEAEIFGEEAYLSGRNSHIAFQMLREFTFADDKNSFLKLLDKYGEVIFERLCAQKFMLAIDNVQFFNEYMIYFLSYIIRLGVTTNRKCSLVIVAVFNTDYMSSNSNAMELLLSMKDLHKPFSNEKLRGFKDKEEARSFLVHLLSNNVDLVPIYLNKIIEKTGTNPFQIMQTLRWMQDTDILTIEHNSCYIKDINNFYKQIQNIPSDVEEIIKDRWHYFLAAHEEEKGVLILSAIHFFEYLTESQILLLELDRSIIFDMESKHFLEGHLTEGGYYLTFGHDIIERFFGKFKAPLTSFILTKIKELNIDVTIFSKIQQNFYILYFKQFQNAEEIYAIINSASEYPIPLKLAAEYNLLIFDALVDTLNDSVNGDEWISNVHKICTEIRDLLGSEPALKCYEQIVSLSRQAKNVRIFQSIEFGGFMGRYCETLNENGKYEQAYNILKAFVDKTDFSSEEPEEDIRKKRSLCNLLNRLHVYKRHLCDDPELDTGHLKYLEQSMKLSKEIGFTPISYTNYSDMGYIYYCEIKNKDKILGIWKHACEIYETGIHPQAHLNYLRKRVQVGLIEQDVYTAIEYCNKGLDYIRVGEYAYERLFFKNWFYSALAECYLIENAEDWTDKIEEALVEAEESDFLLGTSKTFNIYYLRFIQYYYLKQDELSLLFFEKAYKSVHDSSYQKFKTKTMAMLVSNLMITGRRNVCKTLSKIDFITDIRQRRQLEKCLKMDDVEFDKYYNNYTAASLIRSLDDKINFPCL